MRRLGVDAAGDAGVQFILNAVMFALVAGFLKVVFQLLFGVPPALADSPHLLGAGCGVCMLVRTEVPRRPSVYLAHTCIVPPGGPYRKGYNQVAPSVVLTAQNDT
jgi:hypothetical protein